MQSQRFELSDYHDIQVWLRVSLTNEEQRIKIVVKLLKNKNPLIQFSECSFPQHTYISFQMKKTNGINIQLTQAKQDLGYVRSLTSSGYRTNFQSLTEQ